MHGGDEMQRVYAALASGVVVLDAQGCVVEANAAAEEILGVSLDALRGHSLASPRWTASRPDGRAAQAPRTRMVPW